MLDIKFIRENKEKLQQIAEQKNIQVDLTRLLDLDKKRRELLTQIEEVKFEKNKATKQIPNLTPEEKEKVLVRMKEIDTLEDTWKKELDLILEKQKELMYLVPQIVDERTPIGKDDSQNIEIKKYGEVPEFNFTFKDHVKLGEDLDIIDLPRAVKIGGSRSYLLKGAGARLEWGVLKYAMDFISKRGYDLMSVPVLVGKEAFYGTGHFPGSEEDTYTLEKDNKYLAGTSEVPIASYYRDEILDEADLPIRFAGISSCFRREAGTYGKDTHGLYRIHQFNKVEQFVICKNDIEESKKMFTEMLNNSEEFLQSLQIPYRILNVCTGDMGQGKYYMNDIESWMPSRNSYGETHSCSALLDFQARRLNLRYRDKEGKIHYCHTLNNTVVATPRVLIPLLELNQTEDGSINIPQVLQDYMSKQTEIKQKP